MIVDVMIIRNFTEFLIIIYFIQSRSYIANMMKLSCVCALQLSAILQLLLLLCT